MKGESGKPTNATRQTQIPHSKPYIDEHDIRAVEEVLRSGGLVQGKYVREFERRVGTVLGQRAGIAVNSGTAALHLALVGLGVRSRDFVAMPTYSCAALLHAAEFVGARPLFVDVRAGDVNIDADDLMARMKRLDHKLSAVIAPHMFGRVCDLEVIREVVGDSVPIIEDVAHALGNPHLGKGDAVVCSFYATKMITTGEGGMLLARDKSFLEKTRDLRDYDEKPEHRVRYNYKMTDFQAALGMSQLRKLKWFIARRRELSRQYGREEETCFRFILPTANSASTISKFVSRGVQARAPVFVPLHRYLGQRDSEYPETTRAMSSYVSVPLYPALRRNEVRRILAAIKGNGT